jgi:uncharacterized protein
MAQLKTFLIFFLFFSSTVTALSARSVASSEKLEEQKKFKVCGREFTLEVAKTNTDRNRGLMYRKSVGEKEGMIFVFRTASRQSFWMKNVPISLDILFFDSQGKLVNALTMHPETPLVQDMFLKRYDSTGPAQFVVELKEGSFQKFSKEERTNCTLSPLYKIDESVE